MGRSLKKAAVHIAVYLTFLIPFLMVADASVGVTEDDIPKIIAELKANLDTATAIGPALEVLDILERVYTAEARPLNLQQCLALALDGNKEVQQAYHLIQQTQLGDELITRSRLFPTLQLISRSRIEKTNKQVFFKHLDLEELEIDRKANVESDIHDEQVLGRLTQTLLEFGKDNPQEVQLRTNQRQALYAFEETVRRVLGNVRQNFYIIVLRDEQIQRRVELIYEFLRKYKEVSGQLRQKPIPILETSIFDQLNYELNVINEASKINQLLREQFRRKFALLQLLGEPTNQVIRLEGVQDTTAFSVEKAVDVALKNSFKIARQKEEVIEQHRTLRQIAWEFAPDISMDVGYENRYNSLGLQLQNIGDTWRLYLNEDKFFSPGDSRRFGDKNFNLDRVPAGFIPGQEAFGNVDNYNFVGNFQVSLPIFEGFKRAGEIRRERERLAQQESLLKKTREETELAVRQAFENVEQRTVDVGFARRQAEVRKLQLDITVELQEANVGARPPTNQEVDTFRNQFFNAQDSYFAQQEQLIQAKEQLRDAMGVFEIENPEGAEEPEPVTTEPAPQSTESTP